MFGQSTFLDFTTVGQYTNNFNPWNDNGGTDGGSYAFAESATAGVGGGRGVSIFQSTDTTTTYKSTSWDFSTNGATFFLSTMLKANAQTGRMQFGILNTNYNGLNNNAGLAFETYRLFPTSGSVWAVREQYRSASLLVETNINSVTVIPGHWYKFVVGFTNTAGALGNYSAGCALYDFGPDGLTPGTNLITFATSQSHVGQTDITIPNVWASLRTAASAAIDSWDNFVVYTTNSKPVITLPLANTTLTTGSSATFNTYADGPGPISYAWFTNGTLVIGATGSSYTTPPLTGSYTNIKVIASNNNGSDTNSATITVIVPTLATITNLPATSVQANAATLNGQVLSTGGDTPAVTLYHGPADGGTNVAAWSNNVALGLQNGAFAQTVASLTTNKTYFFTAKAVNSAGTAWATPAKSFTTLVSNVVTAFAPVLTYHNDNTRQGVNTNETILTLANVNTNSFGRVFAYTLDGFVYAQPLVMTNVNIPGKGIHNVVYVVTEHNSVYAFDADDGSGANSSPLWQTSFINPGAGITTVPNGDVGTTDITPEVGITATPVIDPATATIYVEVKTKEGTAYVHRLHALDLSTGLEKTAFNSPVVISATNYPGAGTGDNDGANPPHVLWNPLREHTRVALTLLNGAVYLAYASHGDNGPYHGWLFAYNATNIAQQVGIYNATPNGGLGGFWDGGGGPTVDAQGNLYLQTGNGTFDGGATITTTNNYSMSVMKFATTNGISFVDYFAPSNAVSLSGSDQDLGSSAPIILPDSVGSVAHPHLLIGGGKTAYLYLMDRDNMGRFNGTSGTNKIVQQWNGSANGDRDTTPAFFNNTLYVYGQNSRISAFTISNGLFNTTPVQTPDTYANKGGATVCISANGTSNAIAWALYNSGGQSPSTPCVLRAYNATNIAQQLYASDQLGTRDAAGNAVKFTTPTIANGKVYVGAQYSLTVYGLAAAFTATPIISPNGGLFTNSVQVTLSDATPGAAIYFTLDGTTPTTNSTLYIGPFFISNSVALTAKAFKAGAVESASVSASFINSSTLGQGTGLSGAYWTSTTSAAFTNVGFNTSPSLVRTDSTVNFNWGNGSPDPLISTDNFVVRWTGSVQPQFTEGYTFYTATDDGVRVWLNGQLIIDKWVDQGPTTWASAPINLVAQQHYTIQMDYYEHGGGAQAQLFWSSPLTGPQTIIPVNQLYPATNPPPSVVLTAPSAGSTYTANASVTLSANAAAQFNTLSKVDFYSGTSLLGSVSNLPYVLTATGLPANNYSLTAVATDASGLSSTSAPVNITVNAGTGQPYGLTSRSAAPAFYGMPSAMPPSLPGTLPTLLSLTGVFSNTPAMIPSGSLIPYAPNVPLWSDAAVKTRWFSVPNSGAPYTPDEQIAFATNGEWTFPAGTVFVKDFQLVTNEITGAQRRLETRLLVRDINGSVYGVTYKWRADNSDADLLTASLSENIAITNASGVRTQSWYYPSPADCLLCHTPEANYVLGLKTRQLNGNFTYPSTGVTDNQLRAFNRIGLLDPAINEAAIAGYSKLAALTNLSASLEDRARSYLDANCAQCHRPGGSGPTVDARYDTPLTNQNIVNAILAKANLGDPDTRVVVPKDIWRSLLYYRMDTTGDLKMPPLARNLVDTNAVQVMGDWINSLNGTPALAPPIISPNGGSFLASTSVSLQSTNAGTSIYFTLDSTLPTTNSFLYSAPFTVSSNVTVTASAFEAGFKNSFASSAQFLIRPPVYFTGSAFSNNVFELQLSGVAGSSYALQVSTNLADWASLSTNTAPANVFNLADPGATNFQQRFYRVLELP